MKDILIHYQYSLLIPCSVYHVSCISYCNYNNILFGRVFLQILVESLHAKQESVHLLEEWLIVAIFL